MSVTFDHIPFGFGRPAAQTARELEDVTFEDIADNRQTCHPGDKPGRLGHPRSGGLPAMRRRGAVADGDPGAATAILAGAFLPSSTSSRKGGEL